jgi:hypothetical protein
VQYYIGVDWADAEHAIWVEDPQGSRVLERAVPHTAEGFAAWGRWLDEQRASGAELWAAIERPDGRVVDFLLDHGVVVYPVNPKALDRARDRFRMNRTKSDPFDARVLASFLRTDHAQLHALQPSSEPAQELKVLTRDYTADFTHREHADRPIVNTRIGHRERSEATLAVRQASSFSSFLREGPFSIMRWPL